MNTIINTHRAYTAKVVLADDSELTANVCVSIAAFDGKDIGPKRFLAEHLRRLHNAKAVVMGRGSESVGVPADVTEVRVSARAITTNNRAKKVRLAAHADRIAGFVAARS